MLFTISVNISAQSLDTTFGTNGTAVQSELLNWGYTTELPDGSLILSGEYYNGSVSKAVLAKIKPDGSLDNNFGTGGKFVMDQFSSIDYYESFSKPLVQQDGKLVILYGSEFDNDVDPESYSMKLIRLNTNGSVDNTFSGYSAQNISENDVPYDFFKLSSGKILMYGSTFLMRFNSDGTLDTSYGNNGKRTISFTIEDMNIIGDAIYLFDYTGKKLVKLDNESSTNIKTYNLPQSSSFYFNGSNIYISDYTNSYIVIKKLDSNFNPVNGFGTSGTATFSNDYVGSLKIFQSKGSIITESTKSIYNGSTLQSTDIEYRRINPNGTLDTTFGTAGVYKISISSSEPYNPWSDDYLHSNGKLYHLFYQESSNGNDVYIKRSNLPNEILAVDNFSPAKNIRIIQNPVKEKLQLTDNLMNAKIYDVSGRETGITFNGKQTSVESLKAGVYLINATSESGSKINLKFIKK